MNDVNDRNSITTNTTSAEDNERLLKELRKAFQGPRGSLPEQATSNDNAHAVEHDNVNHPAHYTAGGIECIDAIAAALTCQTDPMHAWLTGQVFKYCWRWPLKNGLEDLKKARFYLDRLIADVERKDKERATESRMGDTEGRMGDTAGRMGDTENAPREKLIPKELSPKAKRLFTDILSELGEDERP